MLKCVSADKLHTNTDTGDISQVQYISYTCMQYIMLNSTSTVQTSQLRCVEKPDKYNKSTFEPDKHISACSVACYAKHTGLQHRIFDLYSTQRIYFLAIFVWQKVTKQYAHQKTV